MKTDRSILLSVFVLSATLLLAGCFDEVQTEYDSEPRVAFSQFDGSFSVTVPEGFGTIDRTFGQDILGAAPLQIQLIGPQRNQDLTVTTTVVDSLTTLQETGYTLPNGTEVVVPADSSTGQLVVNIGDAGLDSTQTRTLTLRVMDASADNVLVADNFRDFTVNVVGQGE
jgi:hypothetical protein